jgi:uncharacterized membrane protein
MNNPPAYSYLENSALAAATLVFGIMAGFFWTYTFNVSPALLQVDGSTYAVVQSLLNRSARHFAFFTFFFGGGVFGALALWLNFRHRRDVSFWLLAAATVIYILGIILYTRVVNLPLNYYTESWDALRLPADWEATRESWNDANAFRVVASFLAFILGLIALVLRSSVRKRG